VGLPLFPNQVWHLRGAATASRQPVWFSSVFRRGSRWGSGRRPRWSMRNPCRLACLRPLPRDMSKRSTTRSRTLRHRRPAVAAARGSPLTRSSGVRR